MEQPVIKEIDWIKVGSTDCVVMRIYPVSSRNVCQVVFDSDKPTSRSVYWDEDHWRFRESPDYGGYVSESEPSVQKLRRGRPTVS